MKGKSGASIDRRSGSARNAVIFLAIAVLFRCLGVVQQIGTMDGYRLVTELVLPVAFCLLTILCVLTCGKHFLWVSLIPMLAGLLFFITRALSADNILGVVPDSWEILLRTLVYLVVSILYSAAVFSDYRLKWALIPIFSLGIVYHLAFEDYYALFRGEFPLTFSGAMMELSVLFLLVGLLFVALALRPVGFIEAKEPVTEAKDTLRGRKKDYTNSAKSATEPEVTAAEKKEENSSSIQTTEKTEENRAASTETAAADPTSETAPADESKPVFDESFFDKPYRPTLTLDPPNKPDATDAEEK